MDLVFIPDDRSRNAAMAVILESAGVSALWTGPITRPPRTARENVRKELGLHPAVRLVVVTSGGGSGDDTLVHFQRCLAALAAAKISDVVVLIVLGPLFRKALRLDPGFPHQAVIVRATGDLHSVIAAADLVMCRGGYGVINESAAGGARVLAAPALRNTDDQVRRVLDFVETGRCQLMRDDVAVEEVARQVERALAQPPGPSAPAEHAGALELLCERLACLATTRPAPEALADLSDIHV
jgi:UDP-N-acetylglucosamine:LPS N-acetylglucosamine transferase